MLIIHTPYSATAKHPIDYTPWNMEWWKSVHLPKSIKDWETQASSTCFEETPEENEQHGLTRQKNRQHINPNKLHQGERVIDVHPTDLSGWDPASKIKKPYYLTTRILWDFKSLSDLTREQAKPLFNVTQEADDVSRAYLKGLQDWKDFRQDIRNSMHQARPPMGQAKTLEIFTFVRDQMLAIIRRMKTSLPTPFLQERVKDVENVTEVSERRSQVISSPVEDRMDIDENRPRPNSRSDGYTQPECSRDKDVENVSEDLQSHSQMPVEDGINTDEIGHIPTRALMPITNLMRGHRIR